ncbi:DUF983 domain-containing protein [Ktedonospora formicarum]|uniref:DUF983 domain-containing protein n=1 Tax=Ktedonospora formicarum TaxID=2778364 RepID=A0A8J3MRL9_9CHLR|nr:DUF983 domain-containing protein [Ktedonospora formicarum]GHO43738.1 hypothetical protein KSX_19010 [Ktedonospora formicarum]
MHIKLSSLLWRGLILRCPICGKGWIFRLPFKMYEQCPRCEFPYDRGEEGYFTSSMAINMVLSELIVAALAIPIAANQSIPLSLLWYIGIPLAILLPFIFFHHSRSFWMAMDHFFHPVSREHLEQKTRIFQLDAEEARADSMEP